MKNPCIFALSVAILFLLAGCENDIGSVDSRDVRPAASASKMTVQDHLDIIGAIEFETFSGSITSEYGGWVQGSMATWPRGCTFTLMVPPGAVPGAPGERTEFSMSIPTYESYLAYADADLPLIIELEPSGVMFLKPITVLATYMPWADETVDDITDYWSISPAFEMFGPPVVWQDRSRIRVMFEVPHFSVWESGPPVPPSPGG
jgi:hypothetical protein